MNYVKEVNRTLRGDFILVLAGGATVTSSEGYRGKVKEYLGNDAHFLGQSALQQFVGRERRQPFSARSAAGAWFRDRVPDLFRAGLAARPFDLVAVIDQLQPCSCRRR